MNEDAFNMSVRKFLKQVGVTSQREIETAVRDAVDSGKLPGAQPLKARVVLTVEGDQMLGSTLLWKRSEEADPRAFEEKALRMHKFLPLSTIGITTLGGEDWYELFGALSAGSTLDNVVLELTFLVQNALDLAEARGEADAA